MTRSTQPGCEAALTGKADTAGRAQAAGASRPLRLADGAARLLAVAGGLLLFAMMLLTFADVTGRSFGHPVAGAKEATEVMLAVSVFLLLPAISWERRHIVIDLLDAAVPAALKPVQALAVEAVGAVAAGFAAWAVARQAHAAFDYGDVIAYLDWPLGWIVAGMAVLLAATAAAFAANVLQSAAALWRGRRAR